MLMPGARHGVVILSFVLHISVNQPRALAAVPIITRKGKEKGLKKKQLRLTLLVTFSHPDLSSYRLKLRFKPPAWLPRGLPTERR